MERIHVINTVTVNPAIDRIVYLDRFERNITNRIRRTRDTMGGKGTHVSLNLTLMGSPSRAFGFAFGSAGRRIVDMLREGGVEPRFVYGEAGESRTNYLLVEEDTRDATLIADRGPLPDETQVEAFYDLMDAEVGEGDLLALSGDASNFPDPYVYNRILERLEGRGLKVFLDASGGSLEACLQKAPYLAKPNRFELGQLVGRTLLSDADVRRAIAETDRYHVRIMAVSMGGDGSMVRAGDALYRVRPPRVNVYNSVGCGDCFLAGMLHAHERGMDVEASLRYATAVSAATAESALSVFFDVERAAGLMDSVVIERI